MKVRASGVPVLFVLCAACGSGSEAPTEPPPSSAPPTAVAPPPSPPAPSTDVTADPVPPECAPLVACCEALPHDAPDEPPAYDVVCVDVLLAAALTGPSTGLPGCTELAAQLREATRELASRPAACEGL